MPQSIISFDYSEANIFGWLASQELMLPKYEELVAVALLPTREEREQALVKWDIFTSVSDFSENWVTSTLDKMYDNLQVALPTRYGLSNHSFITDFVWLKRWMTPIRKIARSSFLEKTSQTDREFIIELFEKILKIVPVPNDLQSLFFLSFEEALRRPLTLVSVEFALDRTSLAIQTQHVVHEKSSAIRQWILLQALFIWTLQHARAVSLGVPEPKWNEWFPPELGFETVSSYRDLKEIVWSSLAGGLEWVVPPELFDEQYILRTDPVFLENQAKVVLSAFLNQSIYSEDTYLHIMKFVFEIELIIETAAVVVSPSLPNPDEVRAVTSNFDA